MVEEGIFLLGCERTAATTVKHFPQATGLFSQKEERPQLGLPGPGSAAHLVSPVDGVFVVGPVNQNVGQKDFVGLMLLVVLCV